jgi:CubicO group peptidase (beta-lactamase class C family)
MGERFDALVRESLPAEGPGGSVIVLEQGHTRYKGAYGLADCAASVPNTTATNFRLASISKQFTAMAAVQLFERGLLTPEDRLTDIFPGFPDYGRKVTMRHLLVHSSGLPDYEDFVPADQTEQLKDRDVLRLLQQQERGIFTPGTWFSYSNSGYCVLALIVEEVSGEPFASFLKRNIFDPVGMHSTVAHDHCLTVIPNRAYGYSFCPRDRRFTRTDQSVTSATLGDGGIYSSVEDLALWDQALYTTKLAGADAMEQVFRPWQDTGEPGRQYGYGWFLYEDAGPRRLEHDGTTIGFRNYVIRIPERRQTVIVLMNSNDGRPKELARKIALLLT